MEILIGFAFGFVIGAGICYLVMLAAIKMVKEEIGQREESEQ